MAKQAKKKANTGSRNADRPNGKAWKKRSGVAASAHNGKSIGGYSLAKSECYCHPSGTVEDDMALARESEVNS